MNELLLTLGVGAWKPLVGALLLPPVPLILIVLLGTILSFRHRGLGWLLVVLGCCGLWLSHTTAAGHYLRQWALKPPPVLTPAEIAALSRDPQTAILVLGGGSSPLAQEYGVANLHERGVARLRYGIYLARQTRLPLAFSGGVAWRGSDQASEAAIAGRIAESEFGYKLRWQEGQSRDTRENAMHSVPMLRDDGIRHIVLVTHDFHMPRAARAFRQAIAASGTPMRLTLAPMGVSGRSTLDVQAWLPSVSGASDTRLVLHEWIGRLLGA
jgi:uncharacterized SAM-binding protein YcdF (DUF218 family)